jgi:hypothetical protein
MNEVEKFRIEEIKRLHHEIEGAFKTSLEKAIQTGELLTEQKRELEHGKFTQWIKDNLPFTDRTAQIYMRLYSERDWLKTETVSVLNLKSAYRLLIEHKGPKESVHSVPLGVFSVLRKCRRFTSNREFDSGILKCFKFKGNLIMAMDRDRGIVYELGNGYDFDEFLTVADFIVRVSSHLGGDAQFKVEGDHIKIEEGKFRTKIPLYQERYSFPDVDLKDSKCLPRNFFEDVRMVYFAVCKDTSKERCRGVFLDKNILYATDTHRIVRCTTDFETDSSFIVPDDLLEIVLTEEDIPESYAIVDDRFWFLFKDHKAFASRVKEPFPNCEKDFNSLPKRDTFCTFEKSPMSSALKRMQPFCEGPLKKMDVKVEEGKILLQCQNSNREAEEEIECEGGGDWSFSVSHDFFESCATRMSRFQYTGDFLYFQEGGLKCLLKILG